MFGRPQKRYLLIDRELTQGLKEERLQSPVIGRVQVGKETLEEVAVTVKYTTQNMDMQPIHPQIEVVLESVVRALMGWSKTDRVVNECGMTSRQRKLTDDTVTTGIREQVFGAFGVGELSRLAGKGLHEELIAVALVGLTMRRSVMKPGSMRGLRRNGMRWWDEYGASRSVARNIGQEIKDLRTRGILAKTRKTA